MNNSQIWFSSWTAHRMKTRGGGTILRQKELALLLPGICQGRGRTNFSIFFSSKNCVFYQMENRRSEGLKNNNTCYLNLGIYFRQDSFILHSCLYFKPGGHKFQLFQTFKHFKGFCFFQLNGSSESPPATFPFGKHLLLLMLLGILDDRMNGCWECWKVFIRS